MNTNQGQYNPGGHVMRGAAPPRPRPPPTNIARRETPYQPGMQGRNMQNQQMGMRPNAPAIPQQRAATYKYTANTRNQYPSPQVIPQGQAEQAPPVMQGAPEQLTSTNLAGATPTEQKQMIGERLFPLVKEFEPHLAGKITGMLLEIDNSELLHMLESRELLAAKVEEAVQVLQAHQAKEAATAAAKTAVEI